MSSIETNISKSRPDQTFSIVMPTYARPQPLSQCLYALANLQYPQDRFEVIVVNDGGQTTLTPVVATFQEQINIKLLQQSNAGPATARNTGAAHAEGEFLAFTDDDCAPTPDWLQALADRLATEPTYAIGGQIINGLTHNLYSTASQILVSYLYTYYHIDQTEFVQPQFFTSNNLALPAAQFHQLGGFNINLRCAEDRELCERWLHAGYGLRYAPEARVYHYHELTLRTFWQQHFQYGRGNFSFHQLRAKKGRGQYKLEPGSFYLNMLRYPFTTPHSPQAFWLALLLLLSQVGNITGFTSKWVNQVMQRDVS